MEKIMILNAELQNITSGELLGCMKKGVLITPNVDQLIKHQRDILENLYSYVSQLSSTPPQAHIISAFIHKIGYSDFDIETGNLLLDELNRLMLSMKNQPLPIDRVEFENRAILFLCLTELKQFLVNRKHAQMLRDNNFYK